MPNRTHALRQGRPDFPQVITLCGSTRFREHFESEQRRLTLEGAIVISVGVWGHQEQQELPLPVKADLDELHLRKIDLADRVHVINVDGYIGDSTRREIGWAQAHGVEVTYLVEVPVEYVELPEWGSVEPDRTDLPICSGEDSDWYGWGHLDPAAFVAAVRACEEHWSGGTSDDEEWEELDGEVDHRWAVGIKGNEEQLRWVDRDTPHALPVTFLQLDV